MTPQQSQALELSIQHWERVVADPTGEPIGPDECALCRAFRPFDGKAICTKCPVRLATGQSGCTGTPYQDFEDALAAYTNDEAMDDGTVPDLRLLTSLAQAELDFLISLREPVVEPPDSLGKSTL